MSELKVTSEKVLEAASSCPDAKRVLEKMFPEVFDSNPLKLTHNGDGFCIADDAINSSICMRYGGEYAGCGLVLTHRYNWKIVTDSLGCQVLIATRK